MQYFCIMNPIKSTIGEGTRILHFFLDTLFIFILSFILYRSYNFYVYNWGFRGIRFGYFFFATTWVYTFLFELIFLQTPAKMITHTKVISYNGKRPNIGQFFMRATVRTTLLSMFGLAWNDKPLHDTFSKTELIHTTA